MKIAKVKDTPGYVRDMDTNAVLHTDGTALHAYKRKREKQKELNDTITDINTMKNEINDIKVLMQRILEKIG
jgi:hypothetical protein